ncbi:hypothetical protein ABQE44_22580 [Mycolicibacterium sp. XJ2546]
MTAPVERRRLPGKPIPREKLARDYEDWRRRSLSKGPQTTALFEILAPKPEETYLWRIQLDCGCVRDAATRDDVERLLKLRGEYRWVGEAD